MSEYVKNLGPQLPLAYGTQGIQLISDPATEIRQNVKNIILTAKGEHPTDPDFGCGLRQLLFAPVTDQFYASIRQEIYSQLSAYMPVISVDDVIIRVYDEKVTVDVKYTILPLARPDTLSLSVGGMG